MERSALDTIARELASIVNAIGGRESLDRNEVQALWMRLYPLKCIAADALAGPRPYAMSVSEVAEYDADEQQAYESQEETLDPPTGWMMCPVCRADCAVVCHACEDKKWIRTEPRVRYCQRCEDEPTIDGGEYCEHCARLLTAAGHIPGAPKPLTAAMINAMFDAIDATNRAKQDRAG